MGIKIIIDGNVEETRKKCEQISEEDELEYVWGTKHFSDILDLYHVLIQRKEYQTLKNYNECQWIVEQKTRVMGDRKAYPMYLQIEHTSYCNARCIMCPHHYLGNDDARHLSMQVFEDIQKWLPFVRMIGLHGYGEPLLAPNLSHCLKTYRKYGVKFYMNTNLSVLPEWLDEFYSDFSFINISCDGATKEVFEKIRCNLGFEEFLNNVRTLRKKAPQTRLVMAVVLMRQNLNQCREFVNLADTLGIQEIMFSKIGINYLIGNYEDSVERYPEVLRKNLKEAVYAGKELGIKVIVPMDDNWINIPYEEKQYLQESENIESLPFWRYKQEELRKIYKERKFHDIPLEFPIQEKCFEKTDIRVKGVCDWLTNNIYIGADGKVTFCCANARYYIGDLNNENLESIWNGFSYKKIIQCFQEGYLPDYCRYCNLLAKKILQNVKLVYEDR